MDKESDHPGLLYEHDMSVLEQIDLRQVPEGRTT